MAKSPYDRARFYPIDGQQYPSVTTVLGIVDKSGPLMAWAVKEQDKAWAAAVLEGFTHPELVGASSEKILAFIGTAMHRVKAGQKKTEQAGVIGTAAHAWIEWECRRRMGEDAGTEPEIPDAARVATMAWEDWAKEVEFEPLVLERTVYHPKWGYAGTLDWIGRVKGKVVLGDYKTSRAVYPEAYLQNIAYREAYRAGGGETSHGLILRLPKTIEDPAFEAVWVPETTTLKPFLAALALWRWQRTMQGLPTGIIPPGSPGGRA